MQISSAVKIASSRALRTQWLTHSPSRSRGQRIAARVAGLAFLLSIAGCEKKEAPPPPAPPEVTATEVCNRMSLYTRSGSLSSMAR